MSRHGWAACLVLFVVACAEASRPGTGTKDAGWEELKPVPDAAPIDAQPRFPFGAECETSLDCASNLCWRRDPGDSKGRCTNRCTNSCPPHFECKTVRFGDTADMDICVSAEETFCDPCQVHRDCGDSSDLCIELTGGKFCTVDCSEDPTVCPAGFLCRHLGGQTDIADAWQCVPKNGLCCIDGDGDSFGKGSGCLGTDCNDMEPRAHDGASEVCDGVDNDCKDGVDVGVVDCKKPSCELGPFGYFERKGEPCVEAKCVPQDATSCGLYTCNGGGETGTACATACDVEDDSKCAPPAHCEESECVEDQPNGTACDESSDCTSGHCQNGFCCASGDCCSRANDCPTFGTFSPVCEDPSTCQGSRGAATCVNNECGTVDGIADDSACDQKTEASTCGYYKSVFCNGGNAQSTPPCPTSCTTHDDCDASAFCDPISRSCKEDLNDGAACGTDSQRCKSGHCQNGFCCDSGDCCSSETNCPSKYSDPPKCTTASACQGTRDVAQCVENTCTTSLGVADDSACSIMVLADDCGLYKEIYCNGAVSQDPPTCPTTCMRSEQCDDAAYCSLTGACVPDEPNGHACKADDQCQSGHCQNGFCCSSGDCCATDNDCNGYDKVAACNSQSSCQGTRIEGSCTASFQCSTMTVDDDSACAGLLANDCGPYPGATCTPASGQPPDQAALCSTSCTEDSGCDLSAHCDDTSCIPDQGKGGYCDEPSDCGDGLFCVDNVCCTSDCKGTCRACDLPGKVGECALVPDGQDPDAECNSVSCAGYFFGWAGDTCYRKNDVNDAAATCGGDGACRSVAEECTAQSAQGAGFVTCDSFCQDPVAGTCRGTTAGSCTNLDQGSATCGTGVCTTSQPKCIAGAPHECTPNWGAASPETCNDIDDNCDGAPDNGMAGDAREPSNGCNSIRTLPSLGSDQTFTENALTLYPAGDVDYYRFEVNETDSGCTCCAWSFCTDEDYLVKVTLSVPRGAGTYRACISTGCGGTDRCTNVGAGTSGTLELGFDGNCSPTSSDSYTVHVRVEGVVAPGFECAPYELKYSFITGQCGY
ncbi:MAG: putative metal-binding motif-containing protein [Deltaproteobacteria bacterium]|nr:putative metal-binding motif-containing protein [Deltaproteobacteria bacterium]